ncbi:PAS domain-containing hybrid sensor histidine kinase/response regulator [Ferrimonas marina]|uniref:histidine kinase n=1 Tax=Ferrimonas marina TaxID=299255 RepID=A0A1M5P6Q1_9GAMM|nr:PAS domain-containing hybrid sensor histidine kinase/response regulator [Ferrimonas marina]SHG96903.1 Na+/proline symporter [Ferrimonas marina]
MLSSYSVLTISLLYITLLFFVAWSGERWFGALRTKLAPWIYGFSLAVYCSSWSILGTVGQAAYDPWAFLPIYIGPILLFTVGFGFLRKLVMVSKAQNITSVADFIAARYGKSQLLAGLVTLIATLGLMPYMALQLKASVVVLGLFGTERPWDEGVMALMITLTLALFAILFGTRKLDATEHNPGMILAVAFESLVKLVAFLLVGGVLVFGVFNGPWDVLGQAQAESVAPDMTLDLAHIAPEVLISMAAFVCLPRIFHTMVVECEDTNHVDRARWVLPLYLVLISVFVVPLAMAGRVLLGDTVPSDTYMITMPQAIGADWLAVVALLGTISAASSMVIVAVVTVSIMISNEWLVPLSLRAGSIRGKNFDQFAARLLNARRAIILMLLLLGFAAYTTIGDDASLARIGMLAFGAFAQLAPGLVMALYWKHGHRNGVLAGLAVGFGGWCLVMLQPMIGDLGWLFLGLDDAMSQILLSLLGNALTFFIVSLLSHQSVSDRIQASAFLQIPGRQRDEKRRSGMVSQQDLLLMTSRFVGPSRAYRSFARYFPTAIARETWNKSAEPRMVEHAERLIATVLGASSAATVMESVMQGRDLALDEVFSLVDDASAKILLSQDQMRGAIEHAFEGISVVDPDLNLVAWNRRYEELFDYPEDFLKTGMPVAEIIRYNAALGRCGPGPVSAHVAKRVAFMQAGSAHTSERRRSDGRVIRMRGNPMPGGGFVMTFSDITDFRAQEQALKDANENLEARVAERTSELAQLNARLLEAKAAEEVANQSKTKFLAAVGHDLMQPLNAARLFTASLMQGDTLNEGDRNTVSHIAGSLKGAGEMLSDLLDISKLEAGTMAVNRRPVNLQTVLGSLMVEFEAMAANQGLKFSHKLRNLTVDTDPNLLRRVVQNFLTNALRYTDTGRILLACRRRGDNLELQIYDTGCGIDDSDVKEIFKEFRQLNVEGERVGLGLGLAIVDRIAKVLGHPLAVRSNLGQGSMFSVTVPLARREVQAENLLLSRSQPLKDVRVLCIDNEESILAGLESLLSRWQCKVVVAKSFDEARIQLGLNGFAPDIMLADYHLDEGKTGLEAMDKLRGLYGQDLPGILITADTRQELMEEVAEKGYGFMAKMVRPAALRAMISASLKAPKASPIAD